MNEEIRFLKKVRKTDSCWLWMGARAGGKNKDYGYFRVGKKLAYSHRVSFRIYNGPIPEGFNIDHLCKNTLCVNPKHLEAVSQRENLLRGNTRNAINARKTHCLNGHEFTPENTYWHGSSRTKRGCIHCRDLRNNCKKARLRRLTPQS